MKDVIEMLLQKQSTLEADKEQEKALAVERIESEYAERSVKIAALLDMAGYIPPVEEPDEQPDEQPEAEAETETAEAEPKNEQRIY
jgi:hypothetical protein